MVSTNLVNAFVYYLCLLHHKHSLKLHFVIFSLFSARVVAMCHKLQTKVLNGFQQS